MALGNLRSVIDAQLSGKSRRYNWRKNPSQVTTQGIWFDMSMSPGLPAPKYWFDAPPLIAKAISQSSDGGFFHGANVSPESKYLRKFTLMGNTSAHSPVIFHICDYLLYYPSIDDSTTDVQLMDNTVTLPRYTDGDGVQMVVVSVAGRTGGQTFTITYTNQDGVTDRTTPTLTQNTAAAIGSVLNSTTTAVNGASPFVPLADGDTGVREVTKVLMNGADVGLFSILLVKPLATVHNGSINSYNEKDFLLSNSNLPKIEDDAYLNCFCLPNGALNAGSFLGDIQVIWG